jgi:LacI family transcriptional regulator
VSFTIKDVAERARVSPATVSRVLNGQQHHIRPETRERVLKAVQELGYLPDRRAQALRRRRTGVIGVLTPDISNPFFSLLVRGIEHEARAHGCSVLICDSQNTPEGEDYAIEVLLRERVDGVIVTSVLADNAKLFHFLRKGIALVVADRPLPHLDVPTVTVDSVRDGYKLTRHLLELGYERIAFIQGPSDTTTALGRLAGYKQALQERGLKPPPGGLVPGDYTFEGGYRAAKRLLRRRGEFDAIIAANDLMGIGALYALRERGIAVPEEVGLAGFDDIPMASWVHPRLTTIAIPAYRIGREAMRLLAQGLHGRLPRSTLKLLPTRLVQGQSCRARKEVGTAG